MIGNTKIPQLEREKLSEPLKVTEETNKKPENDTLTVCQTFGLGANTDETETRFQIIDILAGCSVPALASPGEQYLFMHHNGNVAGMLSISHCRNCYFYCMRENTNTNIIV